MIKEPYPGAVSFYDRRNYYYEILNYWNTIILETKPIYIFILNLIMKLLMLYI